MLRVAIVFILIAATTLVAAPPGRVTAACYGWNSHIYWCSSTSTVPTASTPSATPAPTATSLTPAAVPPRAPTSVPPTATPMPTATSTPVPAPVVAPQRGKYLQDMAIERNGSTLTLPVFTSLPLVAPVQGVTRAIVVIHGTKRNAVDYFDYASAAVPADVLVVAPRFKTSSDAPRSTELLWSSSAWKQGGESTGSRPWHISSFEATDEVVRGLRTTFPDLGVIVVAGHSAGGQFVQRYAATNVDARMHFVVANPSSYLYFGRERPAEGGGFAVPSAGCSSYDHYKYGLQDLAADAPYMAEVGASALSARYRAASVTYLLGALDTDPHAADLDVTCEAELQGASRFERGQQFYRHLSLTFGEGVTVQHRLAVVSGVGHDARSMFASAAGRAALLR